MHLSKVIKAFTTVGLLVLLCAPRATYAATIIEYVATDLADFTPGVDLWRYDYTVSGAFLQSQVFDIYFDSILFSNLTSEPAPNADWDVTILQQPNPVNLPPFDTGIFDAFALVDNASLAGAFSVSFVYLGPGRPGSQQFDIFDSNFDLLESGSTTPRAPEETPAVPEPSTVLLSLAGFAVLALKFRRAASLREPTC